MAQNRVPLSSVKPVREIIEYIWNKAKGNKFFEPKHVRVIFPDGKERHFSDVGLMDSLTVILIVPNKETGRFSLVMFEEWKFAEKGYLPTAPSGFMDKSDKGSLLKAAERILQKELGFGLKDMPGHRWLEFNLGGRPRSAFSGSVEGSVGTRETTNTICASQYGVGIFAQSLPPVLEGKGAWLADLCPQGVDDLETRQITDRHSPVRLYAREAMIWLGQQGFIDWHGNPTEKAQWMFN